AEGIAPARAWACSSNDAIERPCRRHRSSSPPFYRLRSADNVRTFRGHGALFRRGRSRSVASSRRGRTSMPIHRRALLRRIGVGSAAVGVAAGLGWSATSAAPARAPALEPSAGSWKTWLLASGDQFRAPPPPGAAASRVELRRLRDLVALR